MLKKSAYLIPLAALLLAAGCSKVEVRPYSPMYPMSFQTAGYPTRIGIEGSVFPTSETFGAWAWAEGTIGDYFMDDETVSYTETEREGSVTGAWTPSTTYYWPKGVPVDFVCYYPAGMSGVTVAQRSISYEGIDVNALQQDIMYSDKAARYTDDTSLVEGDALYGLDGVPVLFRHALAKVRIYVRVGFSSLTSDNGTVTDWSIDLNGIKLDNVLTTGSCALTLKDQPAFGQIGWDRPADRDGFNVWTADGTTATLTGLSCEALPTEEPGFLALPELFVLPQSLLGREQTVTLDLTINTSRNGVPFITEHIVRTAALYIKDDFQELPAWEMNNAITYYLVLYPTGNGADGSPEITFDPAVAEWDHIEVATSIIL